MNIVRGLLFNLLYTLSVILFSLSALIIAPLLRYPGRLRYLTFLPRGIQRLLTLTCGITYRIEGKENIPTTPFVLVSNHQSTWETLILAYIFNPITAVLKKELTYIPFFGWLIYLGRPIVIDRKRKQSALKDILRQGQQRLEEGVSILIFPEGTRVPVDETRPHMPGGAMLACKAGVPVLPVVHNAGRFWPAHQLGKQSGEITIRIGLPIPTAGRSPKELNQQLENWINEQKQSLPS
ncbi:MAG TPA: lysophospholipid acyltransferase family protein [Dongiaceae bacterium]|nr:lysophospholipid acyltransferase family protein [Dongiaceae bacterium]